MVLREMVEMVEMVGWQRRLVKRMMRMVVRSDKRQLRMHCESLHHGSASRRVVLQDALQEAEWARTVLERDGELDDEDEEKGESEWQE